MTPRALIAEIRRRNVLHVTLLYAIVAIGVIEAADLLVPNLGLPDVVTRAVVALAVVGLPFALGLAWAYEWTPDGIRPTPRGAPLEETFLLDEEVCRRLDRARLDPRIVGDRLHYLDNHVRSDALFVYLHGLGLDASQFATTLRDHPHHAVAPTLYGFEPDRETRIPLEYDDHIALLRAFLDQLVRRHSPSVLVVVGFSAGADVAMCLVGQRGAHDPRVAALLALGPNLGPETLFATRVFAAMANDDHAALPRALSSLGAGAADLQEWLEAHDYLVRIISKFHDDLEPLRRFARGLADTFDRPDHQGFIDAYRAASRHVDALLCVVADTETERAPLERIRMLNLDHAVLGDRFRPGSLRVETGTDHFQLLDPQRHLVQIDELFALLRRTTAEADAAGAAEGADEPRGPDDPGTPGAPDAPDQGVAARARG